VTGAPPRSGPERESGGAPNTVRGLAAVLGVLLVLAGFFCYLVLPGVIEGQLAQRLQERFGLPTKPDVEVSSSFPPELLLGRIDRVRMDAGSARADVRGTNVSVPSLLRGKPVLEAENCSMVAEVPGASTQQYLECRGYLGPSGG
jgi:hypothetical protein